MLAAALVLLLDTHGYVAVRGVNATGPVSWLEGGPGRLEAGGSRDDVSGVAQLGVEWNPSQAFTLHVSGAARRELGDGQLGLIEAYATERSRSAAISMAAPVMRRALVTPFRSAGTCSTRMSTTAATASSIAASTRGRRTFISSAPSSVIPSA